MSNLDYTERVRNHLYLVTGYTRYTHVHHVPHVEHMESCRSDKMAKHGQAVVWSPMSFILLFRKVNYSGADAQVVCYPVIFYLIIEQLTIFYISGLVF